MALKSTETQPLGTRPLIGTGKLIYKNIIYLFNFLIGINVRNRRVYISKSMITTGTNVIAVVTKNMDTWSFFDLELSVKFADTRM